MMDYPPMPTEQHPESIRPSADRPVSVERVRHTLYSLVLATVVCGGMLLARFAYANQHRYRFAGLFGNLLLAWIPLILALLIRRISSRGFWFWFASLAWILFFPNAFYIVTDLIHLNKFGTGGLYPWYDILLTAGFACSGMFTGTLSLYLLHLGIRQRFGWRAGWLFAGSTLALGALGIYLGRFLRLNSWDVVTRPAKLAAKVSTVVEPTNLTEVAAFSATFFLFSLAVYSFLVSMARLHEIPSQRELRRDGPGAA